MELTLHECLTDEQIAAVAVRLSGASNIQDGDVLVDLFFLSEALEQLPEGTPEQVSYKQHVADIFDDLCTSVYTSSMPPEKSGEILEDVGGLMMADFEMAAQELLQEVSQ
jgi:hypothetical protein